jgi:hypothetical protein
MRELAALCACTNASVGSKCGLICQRKPPQSAAAHLRTNLREASRLLSSPDLVWLGPVGTYGPAEQHRMPVALLSRPGTHSSVVDFVGDGIVAQFAR